MSSWQPCGRRLRECIDDVCRHMDECAWPPETPAGLDTGGKGEGAADSVSSEVTAAPSPVTATVTATGIVDTSGQQGTRVSVTSVYGTGVHASPPSPRTTDYEAGYCRSS